MQLAITIIFALAIFILGLFIFRKNRKSHTNLLFSIFCFSLALCVVANYLSLQVLDKFIILFWMRIVMALAVIQSVSFFLFIHTFPRPRITLRNKYLYIILSMALLTIIISFTPFLFKDVLLENNKRLPIVQPGILLFLVTAIGSLLSGFILLIQRLKKEVGLINIQLKYIFYGSFLMFLLILIFNFFLVVIFKISTFVNWLPFLVLPFLLSTTYAITRYRLMDIKIVLRKGIVYGLSIITALAFYTYLAILLKDYLQNTLNLSENWGIFVLILLVALGFPPLKYGVEKLVTIAFFPKVKNLKKKAREIAQDISSKIKLEELVNRFASEVKENISAHNLQVYLKNRKTGDFNAVYPAGFSDLIKYDHLLTNYFKINQEILITEEIEYMKENENEAKAKLLENLKKELEARHIALVIPLQNLSEELDVLIFLENKKNKEAFNLEDISFLQNISSQFNIALANAILYKEALERINYQ